MTEEEMLIDQLPQKTLDHLCRSLENGPTVDWRVLAMNGFSLLYSDDIKIAKIESSDRPAWGLLCDLTNRNITVQALLEALEVIGNKRAISIIMNGIKKGHTNLEMSPPPKACTGQPQESCDDTFSWTAPFPIREKAETLKHPVQETVVQESDQKPNYPVQKASSVDFIGNIFSCFLNFKNAFE